MALVPKKQFKAKILAYKHWCLFGADSGGVQKAAQLVVDTYKTKYTPSISKLDTVESSDFYSLLREEVLAPELFYDYKIIILNSAEKLSMSKINLTELPSNLSLVLVATELKKDSKLRKLLEHSETYGLVNFYKPTSSEITAQVEEELMKQDLKYDHNIPNLIASLLPRDSFAVENALKKLSFFREEAVTSEAVLELFQDNAIVSLDQLCYAFCKADIAFYTLAKKLQTSGISIMYMMRCLQNYVIRLISVIHNKTYGKSESSARQFAQEDLKELIHRYDKHSILSLLNEVITIEASFKAATSKYGNGIDPILLLQALIAKWQT